MTNNNKLPKILDENQQDSVINIGENSFILRKLLSLIKVTFFPHGLQALNTNLRESNRGSFLEDYRLYSESGLGVDCELLEPGKSWKKGKLRMKVVFEFYPDEPEEDKPELPESPLDEFRKLNNS